MKIKFWGVRGSIACPGPDTIKYGGNTSCIEIRLQELEKRFIIDAGSGIRELGNFMLKNDLPKGPINSTIFFTHTHWDHISGFPFFAPIYIPGTRLKIYGPDFSKKDTLKEVVGGQLTYKYFPVQHQELASDIEYIGLKQGKVDLADENLTVTTKYLNHPVLCLGYRFEYKGIIFCTAYDTEPFTNSFVTGPEDPSCNKKMVEEGESIAEKKRADMEKFFENADLLIHDAQYTKKEYLNSKKGWGHSPIEDAISSAKNANVKRLALFHHEPLYTDSKLDKLSETLCHKEYTGDMDVFFAKEGMEIDLTENN